MADQAQREGVATRPSRFVAVASRVPSLAVAAFYLLSSVGWFIALGDPAARSTSGATEPSVVDHLIQVSQVLLVGAASVLLILRRQLAGRFLLAVLVVSLVATIFIRAWTVTFLAGGLGCFLLLLVWSYVRWLSRRGLLR